MMNSSSHNTSMNYQAVSCALHSELELAIMHGSLLTIRYLNAHNNNECEVTVKPYDIVTRSGKTQPAETDDAARQNGEFLLCSDNNGKAIEIRLDYIRSYALSDDY